jgi:hypothetical protein
MESASRISFHSRFRRGASRSKMELENDVDVDWAAAEII